MCLEVRRQQLNLLLSEGSQLYSMSVSPMLARAWLDLVSTFLTAILLVMRRFYHLADWSWWAGGLCPPPVMVWSEVWPSQYLSSTCCCCCGFSSRCQSSLVPEWGDATQSSHPGGQQTSIVPDLNIIYTEIQWPAGLHCITASYHHIHIFNVSYVTWIQHIHIYILYTIVYVYIAINNRREVKSDQLTRLVCC